MRKAVAKPADLAQSDALDAAQLRDRIQRIILDEYIGDLGGELWTRPATRAADRIMEAIAFASGPEAASRCRLLQLTVARYRDAFARD